MIEIKDTSPTGNSPLNITQELLNLYDSYSSFNYYCTLYCQSTSLLLRRHCVELESDYADGIARFAQKVIDKSQGIDAQLQRLIRRV